MTLARFTSLPPQIAALKVEARGYPVPFFVSWIKGEPEFRAVDPRKIEEAHKKKLCWICGRRFSHDSRRAFLIGPMCAVNRISAEPPSHLTCALFAVSACPFLSRPLAKRRPMEGGGQAPAGLMIERNPGVILLWTTRTYRVLRDNGGMLFRVGEPIKTQWFCEGRDATRDEIMESIKSGLPLLAKQAAFDGPEAMAALKKQTARALELVPA